MPISIVRIKHNEQLHWGALQQGRIQLLSIPCTTTAELIGVGISAIRQQLESSNEWLSSEQVEMLSPITDDASVLCQGANYRQHMIDSGMNPDDKKFNMFFTKSSASISAPQGEIVRPPHVTLLDYEVELTLVMAKETHGQVSVGKHNLHEYIAGICIGNDVSARDIQIPQMQFHKGKSYRTFCPLGPVLCLLDSSEMHYLSNLQLTLSVNGEVRQDDNTGNMVFAPAETLTEYSQIVNFRPGDVIMTGTPSGCALGLPSPLMVRLSALLPEQKKWQIFIKKQLARPQYLNDGDIVESVIKSPDGIIHLGRQSHRVVTGVL